MPHGRRGRGRPKKRDLEKETWTAGHKYSWRKMEPAAQNSAEDGEKWSVRPMVQLE